MLSALAELQSTQGLAAYGTQSRTTRPAQEQAKGDTAEISEEAKAAWLAEQQKVVQEDESLLGQLRKYVENPVLAHAMDKMEETVQRMGYDKRTEETVLEELQAVFRSGIPAEGEQTTDSLNVLTENLKAKTGLKESEITSLTGEISIILAEAQEKEAQAGKKADGQAKEEGRKAWPWG